MNFTTLIGMLGGLLLLGSAIYLTAEDITAFINLPGLSIVIGGTLAAALISYPFKEVVRIFHVLYIVMRNEKLYTRDDMEEIVEVSRLWFGGDILATEEEMETIKNPFLRTGIQLLVDRAPPEDVQELLEWRIEQLRAKETAEASLFRSLAMYAPAFGMLGTLIGLVNMLEGMSGGDIAYIGQGMAVALLTTFYGILMANLLFKPIAIKFERRTEHRVMVMHLVMEGISLIAQKRSPAFVKAYLESFVAQYEDELRQENIQKALRNAREQAASSAERKEGES
ncbi:MAG: motility protein A [Pseudomonadota bacterium]